jgi:single-strand DNA-binding protein
MSGGFRNCVQLIGNLGRDPEVRSTAGGNKVVSLSIATSETWTDRQSGERKERTEWHRVVIWNQGLGEVVEKYLLKGAKIFLEGKLATRKWTDQSGQDRYSTEIVISPYNGTTIFLDSWRDGTGSTRQNGTSNCARDAAPSWDAPKGDDPDAEIPF